MKTRAFGGIWGFGDGKICSFLFEFFDFLSFEGIFGAAGTLDPPVRIGLKSYLSSSPPIRTPQTTVPSLPQYIVKGVGLRKSLPRAYIQDNEKYCLFSTFPFRLPSSTHLVS